MSAFLDGLNNFLVAGIGFLFGPIMLVVFFGTGILMTVVTRGVQFRKFGAAFREVFGSLKKKDKIKEGEMSPFEALATALAGCVGNGNVVGPATALLGGGPGAIFWMWLASITGMATKYAEIVLAMHYREKDETGTWRGGVMYILKKGMGKNWQWLATILGTLFAICCIAVSFISCNAVQSNSMAGVLSTTLPGIPNWVWGIVCCVLSGLVIMGGMKRIGRTCTVLTPIMAIIYLIFGVIILVMNFDKIPGAFAMIFSCAFTPKAVWGGITGLTIRSVMSAGVSRGVFSNEAGVGGAPLVHVTSNIDVPAKQGLYGIVEVFFDTIVICTFTTLIIMVSGVGDLVAAGTVEASNAVVANTAWSLTLGGLGDIVVTVALLLFCFSTIIGWCTYGETAFSYLFGAKALPVFHVLHLVFTFIGCVLSSSILWNAADFCNGVMCIPNLFSLIVFAGVIAKDTKQFIDPIKKLK